VPEQLDAPDESPERRRIHKIHARTLASVKFDSPTWPRPGTLAGDVCPMHPPPCPVMPSECSTGAAGLVPVAIAARSPLTAAEVEGAPDQWGQYKRPTPWALDTLDWSAEGFEPRWLGHESSDCAVSFDPSIFSGHGADEQRRFTEGLRSRSDLGIVIWTAGRDDNPASTGFNPFGGGDSVLTSLESQVTCKRLPLGVQASVADGLVAADRDLALRLRNDPRISQWWELDLRRLQAEFPDGMTRVSPAPARLVPLLHDRTGAILAGVAVVDGQRWYFLPRGADPVGLLRWLMQHALPTWAPEALRAARRSTSVDEELQTPTERSLRADLAELETTYSRGREAIEVELSRATAEADTVRTGLLYGRGAELEDAVARALRTGGLRVQALDVLLGGTKSADLLVEHGGKRWIVEIKSTSGAAKESFVADLARHQETWPELRPDLTIAGGVLIVSHHLTAAPNERPIPIYSRPEFVASLRVPVIGARTIFDRWRDQDAPAVRAIFE